MNLLRQSTAKTIKMGPFVDSGDGVGAMTALTIAQADIRISKNGGSFAQSSNVAGATHDAAGWYDVPLDATDTNTLGPITVSIAETGALRVWKDFTVVPANVYDALVAGSDKLAVHADEITAGLIVAASFGADAITAAVLAEDAAEEIAGKVWDVTLASHAGVGSTGEALASAGVAGDPLSAAVPGSYSAGSAGYVIGTQLDAAISSRLASAGYTAPDNASIAAILADTGTDLPALIAAVTSLTSAETGDAVLDEVIEGSFTMRQVLRILLSALGGKVSGAGSSTVSFRDTTDAKTRIAASVDSLGNRSAVTLDGT